MTLIATLSIILIKNLLRHENNSENKIKLENQLKKYENINKKN